MGKFRTKQSILPSNLAIVVHHRDGLFKCSGWENPPWELYFASRTAVIELRSVSGLLVATAMNCLWDIPSFACLLLYWCHRVSVCSVDP